VEAVVITYHLKEMEGFIDFVEEHYYLKATIHYDEFFLDEEIREYLIYSLPIDASIRQHPEWGEEIRGPFR
jgi:hypothetical protein